MEATFLGLRHVGSLVKISRLAKSIECMRLTDMALRNGCEIGSIAPYKNQYFSNPLFSLCFNTSHESMRNQSELNEVIRYLTCKVFEKEQRNCMGQTPLLFCAACSDRNTIGLEALLSAGVDIAAVDDLGRGALHSALWVDYSKCRCCESLPWMPGDTGTSQAGGRKHECMVHPYSYDYDDCECDCGGDENDDDDDDDDEEEDEDEEEEEDDDEDEEGYFWVPSYAWENRELATRLLYHQLRLLLQAGRDPNLQDKNGLTPSDFVRGKPAWDDWQRALTDSGWRYDRRTKQCIRQIEEEIE